MRMPGRLLAVACLLILSACAPAPVMPTAPIPVAGPQLDLTNTAVPLDTTNPARTAVGPFVYAGGVSITAPVSGRLHGLSDLKVTADGTLVAISDFGDMLEARLAFDPAGRLAGVTNGKLWPLKRLDGQPVQGKLQGDAEGLAIMPSGERLVSFERDHRIWAYPPGGVGVPRVVPKPGNLFSENEGMEALTQYPVAGPDAYLVGSEEGEIWLCRLSAACQAFAVLNGPDLDFGLTAFASFGDGSLVVVHRAFDMVRGARILVAVYPVATLRTRNPRPAASMTLAGSLVRDNFEGVALITGPNGVARILLLSDDNDAAPQRTLLMAFDWRPGK